MKNYYEILGEFFMKKLIVLFVLLAMSFGYADIIRVSLTKVDSNIYRVNHSNTYIKTRFCLELAFSSDALLIIDEPGYYGDYVVFNPDSFPSKCDLAKVFKP